MGENYTTKIGNQTITVIVKPNNTIIIEPQNTTKLENLVQTLADKQASSWSSGDLIIASSTIVAFFGFGSFLIIRFKSTKKVKLSGYLDIVLYSVFAIQLGHLSVIAAIVAAPINNGLYEFLSAYTIFFLAIIGWFIRRIIHVENNLDKIGKETNTTKKEFLEYLGEKYKIDGDDLQETLDEYESQSENTKNSENKDKIRNDDGL